MIWIRNAIDEYVFTNLNKYFSLPGGGVERIAAQIPILVLYVSLKWLILWRYLDTHVEKLSNKSFWIFYDVSWGCASQTTRLGAVCDFNSKACEKLTTNSFYVEHEMPLRVSCRAFRLGMFTRISSDTDWLCPWDVCGIIFHDASQGQ